MNRKDDFIVCRCENIYYSELLELMNDSAVNARELKLKSRAGMGFCSARTCGHFLEALTHDQNTAPSYINLKSQPPVRMISFDTLSGGEDK